MMEDNTQVSEQSPAESPTETETPETTTTESVKQELAALDAADDVSLPDQPQDDAAPAAAADAVSATSPGTVGRPAQHAGGTIIKDLSSAGDAEDVDAALASSSGLRKRTAKGRKPSVVVEALAEALLPSKLQPYAKKVGPIFDLAAGAWSKAQPHVKKARIFYGKVHAKLEPYHPEEWVPIILGLVLCFFGGCFATTIAGVEAFRVSGYETVKQCCKVLYDDQVKVSKAWEKDDAKAEVAHLSDQELAKHKFILVCKTVDPDELGKAFAGLNTGLLAVLAALRVRFAQAVTLGAAIGIGINNVLAVHLIPKLEAKARPDFKRWVKPLFAYGTKIFGFMLAMFVYKFIMAFHSATKGAQMACEGLISYIIRNKLMKIPLKEPGNFKSSKEFVFISTALAGLGFYWQLSHGFSLPFPLSFILLPFTVFEGMLNYFIAA